MTLHSVASHMHIGRTLLKWLFYKFSINYESVNKMKAVKVCGCKVAAMY